GHAEHAAENGRAERAAHFRAGSLGEHQWYHAEDERERGHHDGPEPELARNERRVLGGDPFLAPGLGELDDQDRVLARQADQDDEADSREDVDVHPGDLYPRDRTEEAHRDDEDHSERERPALILRSQDQEDENH